MRSWLAASVASSLALSALAIPIAARAADGPAPLAGATSRVATYALPGHGAIQLDVPLGWTQSVEQPKDGTPPTILFTPALPGVAPFKVLVSPMWSPDPAAGATPPTAAELRSLVDGSAAAMGSQSVEKTLAVKPLEGTAQGYYFAATDPAPKPGEFKYLTQGAVGAGSLRVVFTALTNDGQDTVVRQALKMVGTARQK